ncbi:helix-turn-helix domain-containing protein [Massilia glaciei]|uniref:Helix-turn-helix domain-containing protein n=1 Tax=Massilia glaciei TaxID=1524097 RepID=A0A2U2HNI1_9BURK|nr:helix-turn-helix domain-containing protein [Massilia glaciei]PWF48965.1 helix-turn-helix domain-containing protein [Massilia glaciei]
MPSEMEKFQRDLLVSVKQMKRGEAARTTKVQLSAAAEARAQVGLSQQEFACLLGVSARTLQDWEQGRREPNGAAKTLLRVAVAHPEILRELGGFVQPSVPADAFGAAEQ